MFPLTVAVMCQFEPGADPPLWARWALGMPTTLIEVEFVSYSRSFPMSRDVIHLVNNDFFVGMQSIDRERVRSPSRTWPIFGWP